MTTKLLLALACLTVFIAALSFRLWTPDKSKPELEAKYLESNTDYLNIAGTTLHLRDRGPKSSSTIIFLHGVGSSLHTWEPWAKSLSDHFRVIIFDLPGSGLSAPDPAGDYSDARTLEILATVMQKLAISRVSFIGNSMGGRLAWKFAAKYPSRVDKLVLISPDGFESPGFEYGKAPAIPSALKMMRYVLPKSFLRMNLAPAYADPARLSDATVTRYYDLLLAPGARDAIIARMEQTILQPPEPLLKQIVAPTLLLWGEKDAMIPVSNAADYQRAMAHATLVTLPGLGHVPHEEAPDASLPPVRAFLMQSPP
jgi:pimeloyl-ACP methyl ester carboxylesterase